MIPNTHAAVKMISQRMMTTLLPDLRTEYTMADGLLLGQLLIAIADEISEGIERRLKDIREMVELLGQCPLAEGERNHLEAALTDYRLETVNQRHDALTRLLIHYHARSESDTGLESLNEAIWQYLRRHADRHRINLTP